MDISQVVLLSVIIVLSIFLVTLGFQAFFVLKDMRKTLTRLNKFFDNVDDLVFQVKKPVTSAGALFTAITAGAGLNHLLQKKKAKERALNERSEKQ